MNDLTPKSVLLLISKLNTAILTSARSRDANANSRRESLKDELVARGAAGLTDLIDALRKADTAYDVGLHLAEVIGLIGSPEAVIPLAHILAEAHPHATKRHAAKALAMIRTPEAMLALNIWQGRVQAARVQAEVVFSGRPAEARFSAVLQSLAEQRPVSALRLVEAYLLETADQKLAPDAQLRLNALRPTPAECSSLEAAASPVT
ncbi:MAG: HEAT repeat domain-containing protein [Phototrophicaceae bacterium]